MNEFSSVKPGGMGGGAEHIEAQSREMGVELTTSPVEGLHGLMGDVLERGTPVGDQALVAEEFEQEIGMMAHR